MILLILTTVLLVPQWQAMPPTNAATENVVAENDTNTNNPSQENTPQKMDKPATPEMMLPLPREVVAALRPDLTGMKNLSIEQQDARLKLFIAHMRLRFANDALDRALKVNITSPGVITEGEIRKLKADVIQAQIGLFKTEPDYLQNADLQEKVRASYEQLRDMAKTDLERMSKYKKIIPEADMDALKLKLLEAEMLLAQNTPKNNPEAQKERERQYLEQQLETAKKECRRVYARYGGSGIDFAKARLMLIETQIPLTEWERDYAPTEAEKTKLAEQLDTLYKKRYLSVFLYCYSVIDGSVWRPDQESVEKVRIANRQLDAAEEVLLKHDPTISVNKLKIDDYAYWKNELSPEKLLDLPQPSQAEPQRSVLPPQPVKKADALVEEKSVSNDTPLPKAATTETSRVYSKDTEETFKRVYGYWKAGDIKGSTVNLINARLAVIDARIAETQARLTTADSETQKNDLTQNLKKLYQESWIASNLYVRSATDFFATGKGTFDELTRAKKQLADKEIRLREKYPDLKIEEIDVKNVSFDQWNDELSPEK